MNSNPYQAPFPAATTAYTGFFAWLICFAVPMYPVYLLLRIYGQGLEALLRDFSDPGVRHVIEPALIYACALLGGVPVLWLRTRMLLKKTLSNTLFLGVSFAFAFVLAQPFIIPFIHRVSHRAEPLLPFGIGEVLHVVMSDQPYILLPTILVASVVSGCSLLILFMHRLRRTKRTDEPTIGIGARLPGRPSHTT